MSRFQRGGLAFQKPENALKRAEELVQVGQKSSALQALHDVITSKRHRTWQKVLEQIMFRYVELCVELKRGRFAKDGLIHYRNVCQQVNVSSLEEVIKYFLKTATDKAEEAKSKAAEAPNLTVDDLEADATAEDLMLSYVSGEKGKDRTDRELVTPWFKFLWETYRSVLDILRNNARLESLYAMTAAKAFGFCLTYKRTTEFRRLCDILRNHLANLNKYRDQRDRPDLTNPDSLNLYLETRFEQLRVACELELWQEAFRSVEDIQGLSAIGKKPPKPQLLATYYAKLTRIFAVSDNYLYNGYAWFKLFQLARTYNKNLTAADTQLMASSVVLAALAIPPYEASRNESEAELDRERSQRMAGILGFSADPRRERTPLSRAALIADLSSKGFAAFVPDDIKHILSLMESEFTPLQLCHKLAPLLEKLPGLATNLSAASPIQHVDPGLFRKPLEQVAVMRLLQQLSQVYSTMSVSALQDLVPFMRFEAVEQVIVEAVKYDFIQVQIDHRSGTVHFGGQQLESDAMKDHLSTLASRLSQALKLISPAPSQQFAARKQQLIGEAIENADKENRLLLARKRIIEKRKEEAEQKLQQAEMEEENRRLQQARLSEAMEEERRRADRMKREEDRIQREMQEREEEEARNLLAEARRRGSKVAKIKEGEKLDKRTVQEVVLSEQSRAREEAEKKMGRLIKHLDHLERAHREEEAPLLEAAYAKKVDSDKITHEEDQDSFAVQHQKAWDLDITEKHRLSKMVESKEHFAQQIVSRRQEEFEALRRQRERKIAENRAQKRRDRDLQRKREYVRQCRDQLEERRLKEEAEALQRELEQKEREEAERQRKLEEAAEKQRKREAELEAKAAEEKARAAGAPPSRPPPAADAPSARSGGYVPPSRRSASGAGSSFAAPAARAAAAVPNGEAPAPRQDGDRWTPGGRAQEAAPAAKEEAGSDNRWRRSASTSGPTSDRFQPPSRDAPAPAPAPAPAGDRWRPGGRSDSLSGDRSGDRRPGDSFGADRRSSGTGGAFVPPGRRSDTGYAPRDGRDAPRDGRDAREGRADDRPPRREWPASNARSGGGGW